MSLTKYLIALVVVGVSIGAIALYASNSGNSIDEGDSLGMPNEITVPMAGTTGVTDNGIPYTVDADGVTNYTVNVIDKPILAP